MRDDHPPRCDGCGEDTTTGRIEHTDDEGTIMATYCPGCDLLRTVRGLQPAAHDLHQLVEASR